MNRTCVLVGLGAKKGPRTEQTAGGMADTFKGGGDVSDTSQPYQILIHRPVAP